MIPLRDDVPSRRFPIVNIVLILLNLGIFMNMYFSSTLNYYIMTHGVIPRNVFTDFSPLSQLYFFTYSIFLHGGWLHVLGNMLYLWIFGDNVEDRMGHLRYLIFYLLCGYAATLTHVLADPSSNIPVVGASGAIAGVLGAYLLLFPRAKVLTIVPIFIFLTVIRIPAVVFLGLWFILQFFNGTAAAAQGVAWWAHVGGFIAGMILVNFMAQRNRYYY